MTAPTGRVVVGVSQSLPGLHALRHAVREARTRRTTLFAVRACPHPPTTRSGSYLSWERAQADGARRYVTAAFDAAMGELPGDLDITLATPVGPAGRVLKESARHAADLVVVGAPASRWWHSRVVRECTRGCVCPVIVVPPPELSRQLRGSSVRRAVRDVIRGR